MGVKEIVLQVITTELALDSPPSGNDTLVSLGADSLDALSIAHKLGEQYPTDFQQIIFNSDTTVQSMVDQIVQLIQETPDPLSPDSSGG